jgi:hypothetical protein
MFTEHEVAAVSAPGTGIVARRRDGNRQYPWSGPDNERDHSTDTVLDEIRILIQPNSSAFQEGTFV